jgi:hypothetical protein
MALNQYIKENGIICLINKYADYNINDIFCYAEEIMNRLYYNDKLLDNPDYLGNMIVMYILTNNSLIIQKDTYGAYNSHVYIYEIKFDKRKNL